MFIVVNCNKKAKKPNKLKDGTIKLYLCTIFLTISHVTVADKT